MKNNCPKKTWIWIWKCFQCSLIYDIIFYIFEWIFTIDFWWNLPWTGALCFWTKAGDGTFVAERGSCYRDNTAVFLTIKHLYSAALEVYANFAATNALGSVTPKVCGCIWTVSSNKFLNFCWIMNGNLFGIGVKLSMEIFSVMVWHCCDDLWYFSWDMSPV